MHKSLIFDLEEAGTENLLDYKAFKLQQWSWH